MTITGPDHALNTMRAVRPLDVHDDADLAAAHAVMAASQRHQRPWAQFPSLRELTVQLRRPSRSVGSEACVVTADGVAVGLGLMWLPLTDNLTQAWLEVDVHPDHRRRGVGSIVLDHLVDRARTHQRSVLLFESNIPDRDRARAGHPHRHFAEKAGFAYANTEIRRILELPVDPVLLERLTAESAPHHAAYRIETHVGGVPEHLQESYCACWNQLGVDAPTGEMEFEEEALTPDLYREELGSMVAQGRTFVTTVGISPEGAVVAYNDLVVLADDPDNVLQWGTLVRRDHRGHRLGMAVKARGLRELARLHPEHRRIQTANAEQNSHMVGINEALGFRRVEALVAFQRKLT